MPTKTNTQPGVMQKKTLNSNLSNDTMTALTDASTAIKTLCSKLAGLIEDQVTNPNPQTSGENNEIVSQRLLEWTSDLYAIAEDIDFYVVTPTAE